VFFDSPERPLTAARFRQRAAKHGVALSRKTRMLYRGKHVFINGESFAVSATDKAALSALANTRRLDGNEVEAASQDVMEALHTWYEDGWLTLP
jgi:50S ribosomal protein L16 3-hydroxylase